MPTQRATLQAPPRVVIGLGNPGAERAGSPHNIGHTVLDHLAENLKSDWLQEGDALIGRAEWKGRKVCLVKLQTGVNKSGGAVRVLAGQHGFYSSDCIIVYDDLDLPLGVVRARMRGSAGGHKGVASILDAFQTDKFARVKVGVGRPDKKVNLADYMLKPFPEHDRPVVDQACAVAAERVLNLI